jgi:hypothetical protein
MDEANPCQSILAVGDEQVARLIYQGLRIRCSYDQLVDLANRAQQAVVETGALLELEGCRE